MSNDKKEISIVIPAYNEAENLPVLCDEIRGIIAGVTDSYEIIIIL